MVTSKVRSDQRGFASIVIAIVLVIVLGLITTGFAELMRHEENDALNKHLNEQAYYAAESGVNDAAKAINDGFNQAKPDCGVWTAGGAGSQYLTSNQVGPDNEVNYSCLLIDPSPPNIQYSSIDPAESKIVEISSTAPAGGGAPPPIKTIKIGWQDAQNGSQFVGGGSHDFATGSSWYYTGILRISLTPLASSFINRDSLINNTYNAFLYPNAYGTPNQPGTALVSDGMGDNSGVIVNGNCNRNSSGRYCTAIIDMQTLGQSNYLLAMRSVYKNVAVTVSINDYSGQPVDISNAQSLVDATGKAEGILRRVQVRIPSFNNYPHSDYGLATMNTLCKQLQLIPSDPTNKNACDPLVPSWHDGETFRARF